MSTLTATTFLHDTLVAAASITSRLSTYNGVPAIFTATPVPDEVSPNWLVILPAFATEEREDKTAYLNGFELQQDVIVAAAKTGSIVEIEQLANDVREELNRADISGQPLIDLIRASAPIAIDSDNYYGRVTTVTMIIRE